VRSRNGVRVDAQRPLEFANEADVVLFGSGKLTAQLVQDTSLLSRLRLDPRRQLIGSQCSGALFLVRLGLVEGLPVCTDFMTRPLVEAAGTRVLDQTFVAHGNVASAGGGRARLRGAGGRTRPVHRGSAGRGVALRDGPRRQRLKAGAGV
jgi:transcriptional regulator GlxA family with amidase domain